MSPLYFINIVLKFPHDWKDTRENTGLDGMTTVN